MELGPVQMLVLEFDRDRLRGEILPELQRLREQDIIRLVDLLIVEKDENGEVRALETSDLAIGEAMGHGGVAHGLVDFGAASQDSQADSEATAEVWYVADVIPPGSLAAIALIEHRWAVPLRDAVVRAGGVALADEWIHPEDLAAVGVDATAGS